MKVQRWRGAVWVADDTIPWLVAAGQREGGSPDDFYTALATRGKAARSQYNAAHTPPLTTDTHTDDLLPAAEDELRWKAEHALRMERRLRVTVHSLLRESLLEGRARLHAGRCRSRHPGPGRGGLLHLPSGAHHRINRIQERTLSPLVRGSNP